MIIGFSGKKQSGKSSCAKWIIASFLKYTNLVSGAGVKENGDLFVEYLTESGESISEVIDLDKGHSLLEAIRPFVSVFSFADELKGSVYSIFRVRRESLWGTNEEKDAPTHILWNDIKKLLPKKLAGELEKEAKVIKGDYITGRGLMQIWGTDICRTIQDDCWIAATIANIKDFGGSLSLIPDVRFPNEVAAIQKAGGKVIRLARNPVNDSHDSETALDNFPREDFDKVIENQDYSMSDLCKNLYFSLREFGALPFEIKG